MCLEGKIEDTKRTTRSRISKDRQYNGQKTEGQTIQWPKEKKTNGQTMILEIIHIKLKIEQHESY